MLYFSVKVDIYRKFVNENKWKSIKIRVKLECIYTVKPATVQEFINNSTKGI